MTALAIRRIRLAALAIRRIRRPALDESKGGPTRIRRAVETGLPYGPTTRCVGTSLGDSAASSAGGSRPSRAERSDLRGTRGTADRSPGATDGLAVATAPCVVPPIHHGQCPDDAVPDAPLLPAVPLLPAPVVDDAGADCAVTLGVCADGCGTPTIDPSGMRM